MVIQGQTVISLNNQSISFALVGPKRLFADAIYTPMVGVTLDWYLPIDIHVNYSSMGSWLVLSLRLSCIFCTVNGLELVSIFGVYQCSVTPLRTSAYRWCDPSRTARLTFAYSWGNISVSFFTWFVLGSVNHLWIKRCQLNNRLPWSLLTWL